MEIHVQTFNRGEWSELYVILYLLTNPNLIIVDSKMNFITDELYTVEKIIFESSEKLEYRIKNKNIYLYIDDKIHKDFPYEKICIKKTELLHSIIHSVTKLGSFEIPDFDTFLADFTSHHKIKSSSKNKNDLLLEINDNRLHLSKMLSYSVKSSLGKSATILNSSQNTNFEYVIENFNPKNIEYINSISTQAKLLDRINKIEELGGKILFNKIVSPTFDYNLRLIDTELPRYLGNALLYSYQKNNKNLKDIFYLANNFDDKIISDKKLSDFLNSTSFGFMPGTKWNGQNTVTGGLLIVQTNGDVVTLDLIYHKDEVNNYLLNNTKLDSPSSSRYHMLELEEKNGKVYFTLNLQVRYK